MKNRKWTVALFVIYLVLLSWVILLKMDIAGTLLRASMTSFRSLNLTLFAGTAVYNGHLDYREIGLNVLFFIPMGIYLKILWPKLKDVTLIAIIIGVSITFETLQFAFAIGAADITDVAANGLGGVLGLAMAYGLLVWWKKQTLTYVNVLAFVGTGAVLYWLFFV